jgi:hypothetical protein
MSGYPCFPTGFPEVTKGDTDVDGRLFSARHCKITMASNFFGQTNVTLQWLQFFLGKRM